MCIETKATFINMYMAKGVEWLLSSTSVVQFNFEPTKKTINYFYTLLLFFSHSCLLLLFVYYVTSTTTTSSASRSCFVVSIITTHRTSNIAQCINFARERREKTRDGEKRRKKLYRSGENFLFEYFLVHVVGVIVISSEKRRRSI